MACNVFNVCDACNVIYVMYVCMLCMKCNACTMYERMCVGMSACTYLFMYKYMYVMDVCIYIYACM